MLFGSQLHLQQVQYPLYGIGRIVHLYVLLVDVRLTGKQQIAGVVLVVPAIGESAVGGAENLGSLVLGLRQFASVLQGFPVGIGDENGEGTL